MTTLIFVYPGKSSHVVEAFHLERYDNYYMNSVSFNIERVVEAFHLERYDNFFFRDEGAVW